MEALVLLGGQIVAMLVGVWGGFAGIGYGNHHNAGIGLEHGPQFHPSGGGFGSGFQGVGNSEAEFGKFLNSGAFRCPVWKPESMKNFKYATTYDKFAGGYGYPYAISSTYISGVGGSCTLGYTAANGTYYGCRPTDLAAPSETLCIGETSDEEATSNSQSTLIYANWTPLGRHDKYSSMPISWCDGHASVMKNTELNRPTPKSYAWSYYMSLGRR